MNQKILTLEESILYDNMLKNVLCMKKQQYEIDSFFAIILIRRLLNVKSSIGFQHKVRKASWKSVINRKINIWKKEENIVTVSSSLSYMETWNFEMMNILYQTYKMPLIWGDF